MTIGNRIAALRREHGYSQEYVAERLGVSRQAVSKWETDQSAPDTYNLISLSELLGASVEYLATGKSPIKSDTRTEQAGQGGLTVRQIVGLILIGIGLLSLILGLFLTSILLMLAAYFVATGIICLMVRRNLVLILGWALYIITLVPISMITGVSLLAIFAGQFWFDFFNVRFASLFVPIMWIWLLALVGVTIVRIVRCVGKHKKASEKRSNP